MAQSSKLSDLIAKLCPDGVPYSELQNLLVYEQPSKYLVKSAKYDNTNTTPVLTAGQTFILGYTSEEIGVFPASPEDPVIIFDDFTTAFKWVDFPFKVKSSAIKILSPSKQHLSLIRYIYYAMQTIGFQPTDHARHWISKYSKFKIPVPPLEVQQEIVRILDTFSTLEAELEAELEARQRQYAYYRDTLLTFDATQGGVRWMSLGEVATYSKSRIAYDQVSCDCFVGVDNMIAHTGGIRRANFVPSQNYFTEYLVGDVLIGNIRPYLRKIWLANNTGGCSGDVLAIRIKNKYNRLITPGYLYHSLSSSRFFLYAVRHSKGGKMPRGDKSSIMRYTIPIPPLEEQRRIANILDSFDALVNDLSAGLPAELAARRKQYEYYRDQLLNFPEIEVDHVAE
ncbi:restriction endonuclease subunit S [Trueperella sp. LYQ141]